MALNKIANYNIRFCDVIDPENMKIDLTQAEVKENNGKVIYVIRMNDDGFINFAFCVNVDTENSKITFMGPVVEGEGIGSIVLQAVSDTDFYHIVD